MHHGCDSTFNGLNEWYTSKFEKLGWIILAKEKGMMEKVNSYQTSIKRLHHAILNKIEYIKDLDKKHDLMIMKNNVEILIKHANQDFSS